MCQNCFQGEQVDWENLKTPEQQKMMESLYYQMMKGGQQGATQFPGQLSAPMVDMQKMAAKTMSGIGGFGWEQQSPNYRSVPNMYNPENVNDLPVRGGGYNPSPTPPGPGPTPPGPGPTPPGPTPPGPTPPGPRPGPEPRPEPGDPRQKAEVDAILQSVFAEMFGMGGSQYDPRNMMGY